MSFVSMLSDMVTLSNARKGPGKYARACRRVKRVLATGAGVASGGLSASLLRPSWDGVATVPANLPRTARWAAHVFCPREAGTHETALHRTHPRPRRGERDVPARPRLRAGGARSGGS